MSDSTKTIILSNPDSIDYYLDSLPADIRSMIETQVRSTYKKPDDNHSIVPAVFVWCIVGCILFYKIKKVLGRNEGKIPVENTNTIQPDCYYYNGADLDFTDPEITLILEKYCAYYTDLNKKLRGRFLERLKQFMIIKTFRLPKDKTFKEMPVLLSAAAVQLTFGLDDYTLSWFRNINVHAEEYFANDTHGLRVLAGNVEHQSITIAWSHFLSGVGNEDDGSNVGLHELAHALYYQYTVIENEKNFVEMFNRIMQEIDFIYQSGKNAQSLFSDYAFRNTQEFWAESIEIFFERPADLQNHFPYLFNGIEKLLNQDPLNKGNPIA